MAPVFVLALRLRTRRLSSWLTSYVYMRRAHHLIDDSNTWPSSRPSLAGHRRDCNLLVVDYQRNSGSSPKLRCQISHHGFLLSRICDPFIPFDLCGQRTNQLSLFSLDVLSFLFFSSASKSDSLVVREASIIAGSFALLASLLPVLLFLHLLSSVCTLIRYGWL